MTPPRPRGRPRQFDTEIALNAIVEQFREKGFAATSLDDLAAATQLNRPSLYAAFGDKTQMYLAALEAFAGGMAQAVLPALAAPRGLQAALEGFYRAALDVYYGRGEASLGCLVFTTALADVSGDARIKERVTGILQSVDGALAEAITRFAPHLRPGEALLLAQLASGLLINLAARSRAGAKRAAMDRLAKASAALIAAQVMDG